MRLPRLLVLTDRTMCERPLVDVVADAVMSGARAVVLREKDLPFEQRARIAVRLRCLLDPVGGLLVMAGPRGDAVHLSSSDPLPSPRPAVVGRSCHDADEVARAGAEGCDYVTVSPVFTTASKPGYGPALDPSGLTALLTGCPPGYALGGVLPEHVASCRAAGAHGAAVMGPVMRDPQIVSRYLDALAEVAA
ncbi:MAG: thiamine phosphate synthase [Jiangellaceae bacterium]